MLDASHGLASELFLVSVPAGMGTSYNWQAAVEVNDIKAHDADGTELTPATAVNLRVVMASPENEHGLATPTQPGSLPGNRSADQWVVPAFRGGRGWVPLWCEPPGPCTRALRLLATLGTGAVDATITWHVTSQVTWSGLAYPSGLAPAVQISEPVLVSGPPPVLDVAAAPESFTLGPDRPTAIREVEMKVQPGVGADMPTGSLELVTSPWDNGSVYLRTSLYDMTETAGTAETAETAAGAEPGETATPAPGSMPVQLGGFEDPFSKCGLPGECVRHFLATFVWKSGPAVTYHWQLVAHRTDLSQVLSETGKRVTLETIASADPIGPPMTLHLEGDLDYVEGRNPPPISLQVRSQTEDSSAAAPALASLFPTEFLPVPGSVRFTARFSNDPGADARLSVFGPTSERDSADGGAAEPLVAANPFFFCSAETECRPLSFGIGADYYPARADRTPGPFTIHWRVDVSLYSYPGVHFVLEQVPGPIATPSAP